MREITWEGGEKEQKWIPVYKECHESIKDSTVVKEMRAVIARGREKVAEVVEYFCGVCEEVISKNHVSIGCTQCFKWIHKICTEFHTTKEATKKKRGFKCKNCIKGDETPNNTKKYKDNSNDNSNSYC